MEKNNNSQKALIIILTIIVIALVAFIAYDKLLKNTKDEGDVANNTSNETPVDKVEIDYVDLTEKLKETFKIVYTVKTSPDAYCGNKTIISDKKVGTSNNYYLSGQYDSYDEMINDLTWYATEEVIDLDKDEYLEEDGELYCLNKGKGSLIRNYEYIIEVNHIEEDKITASGHVITTDITSNKNAEEYQLVYTKKNENTWIISEYTYYSY